MGDTPRVGTAAAALTPRLPISKEPSGIPARALPPGVVDVGDEEETRLLDPEPHIPDMPAVSRIPDVAGIPDIIEPPDIEASPDGIPDVPAVIDVPLAICTPPPSNPVADVDIGDGEVPRVAHAALVLGIEIVPGKPGLGLVPGTAISVEPNGRPVCDIGEFDSTPSGDVAPMPGVELAIPPTCAIAAPQTNSVGRIAAITRSFTCILL
jgi:hypothetical protein